MVATHQPPSGGEYSSKGPSTRRFATIGDVETMTKEFSEKLGTLLGLLEGDSSVAMTARNADSAAQTQYLTRRVRRWQVFGGAIFAAALALGTVAINLWSYLQGYAHDRAQEFIQAEAAAEAAADLVHRVDANTSRLAKIQQETPAITALQRDITGMRHLNALQWTYLSGVIEDLQNRRRPRSKPPELERAEREIMGSDP